MDGKRRAGAFRVSLPSVAFGYYYFTAQWLVVAKLIDKWYCINELYMNISP